MSYGLIVGQLPTWWLKGEGYYTWLVVVCFFTLLFGCFFVAFHCFLYEKRPVQRKKVQATNLLYFGKDYTPVWCKSCITLIVIIINKEIPKGAPRFGANRCLGSCAGAI